MCVRVSSSWVSDRTEGQKVAGSSPGQTCLIFFNIQTAPSSLFDISLVFTYFCSEKARKVIGTAKSGNGFFSLGMPF